VDSQSRDLARYFATHARDRTDASLKAALRKAGVSITWRLTRQIADITEAKVTENVALIKSIPEQYFTQIEGS